MREDHRGITSSDTFELAFRRLRNKGSWERCGFAGGTAALEESQRGKGQHAIFHAEDHREQDGREEEQSGGHEAEYTVVSLEENENRPRLLDERSRQTNDRTKDAESIDREPEEHAEELGRQLFGQWGHLQTRHWRICTWFQKDLRYWIYMKFPKIEFVFIGKEWSLFLGILRFLIRLFFSFFALVEFDW